MGSASSMASPRSSSPTGPAMPRPGGSADTPPSISPAASAMPGTPDILSTFGSSAKTGNGAGPTAPLRSVSTPTSKTRATKRQPAGKIASGLNHSSPQFRSRFLRELTAALQRDAVREVALARRVAVLSALDYARTEIAAKTGATDAEVRAALERVRRASRHLG